MITITLSAADASAHFIQNTLVPRFFQGPAVPITLFLVALLGAVLLKGFKAAIGIAVALVGGYLALIRLLLSSGYSTLQPTRVCLRIGRLHCFPRMVAL